MKETLESSGEPERSAGMVRDGAGSEGAARCVPPVTIEAFCELESTRRLIESCAGDRRLAAAAVGVFDGGLSAAIERYHDQAAPSLVIVESGMRGRGLFDQLDELARVGEPETKIIVIGAVDDPALGRGLAESGVSDYLVPPVTPLSLMGVISRLFAEPDPSGDGKVVAFVSAKEGAGSSAIARNAAWCAAEILEAPAAIVDFAHVVRVERAVGPHEAEALLAQLSRARGERLALFSAPLATDVGSAPDLCRIASRALTRQATLVALDLPHLWPSWAHPSVVGADEVVVTATPDLESLRNAKQIFDVLRAARPNDPPPRLVLNQVGVPRRPEIPVKSFATFIGVEPTLVLPFDAGAFALEVGETVVAAIGEEKVADGLVELAAALVGREPPQRRRTLVQRMLLRA
jgi:pilus assembly protein CpaE